MSDLVYLLDSWEEIQFRLSSLQSTPPEDPVVSSSQLLSLSRLQIEKLLLEAQRESTTASATETPKLSSRSR